MNHRDVLMFWFGDIKDGFSPKHKNQMWFHGSDVLDMNIKHQFGELHGKAIDEQLDDWELQPHPTLALIIILDQFSRNIHRKTPQAYVGDTLAQKYCKNALDQNWDLSLAAIEKIFLYMPLHHSELLTDQKLCLTLFTQLYNEINEQNKAFISNYISYVKEHLSIIEKFGRFPHRNKILGRANTKKENAYLQGGAPSYGQ